jgi:uroporphyrinogen III methyltransferase/synthase
VNDRPMNDQPMNIRGKEERSSLEGAWVVNTRSPKQARELDALLEQRLAHPLSYPCIDIAPALDPGPLDRALAQATEGAFDWLVFTSANAVEAVETRLRDLGILPRQMARTRVATVGPGTAAALKDRLGIAADLCPDEYLAEALAEQLVAQRAQRVLVPQAESAREALVRILVANGVEVEAVTAYRTVLGSGGADVPHLVREGRVDAVVFASPSAVNNMAVRFERENGDWDDVKKVCIACIGPVTSAAAERRGLEVRVLAQDHTILDLVSGLERYYRNRTPIGERVP